jgi:hypothetical protein
MEALLLLVPLALFTTKLGMLLLVQQAIVAPFTEQALKLVVLLLDLVLRPVLLGPVLRGRVCTIVLILPMPIHIIS